MTIHNNSVREKITVKCENTDNEEAVNEQMKTSNGRFATTVVGQQSTMDTIMPLHLKMNDDSGNLCYGKDDTHRSKPIHVGQSVLSANVPNCSDIKDVVGNADVVKDVNNMCKSGYPKSY